MSTPTRKPTGPEDPEFYPELKPGDAERGITRAERTQMMQAEDEGGRTKLHSPAG